MYKLDATVIGEVELTINLTFSVSLSNDCLNYHQWVKLIEAINNRDFQHLSGLISDELDECRADDFIDEAKQGMEDSGISLSCWDSSEVPTLLQINKNTKNTNE